jgi:hypothetical protein
MSMLLTVLPTTTSSVSARPAARGAPKGASIGTATAPAPNAVSLRKLRLSIVLLPVSAADAATLRRN